MTTQSLYEFLILANTLSYSKAAETLYISQSVLSKHIQAMEKELGTRLLYRSTHSVTLTAAGHLLASKAAPLIDQCNFAVNKLQTPSPSVAGSIHIACVIEFSHAAHIRVFSNRFMERYPDIHIDFHILTEGTPQSLLSSQQYDFIFTPCEFVHLPEGTHSVFIQSHTIYAALYPGHRLLSRPSVHLRQLENETIIIPFFHELLGPYAKNWSLLQKYTHYRVKYLKTANVPTALFEVQLGRGIFLGPKYVKNLLPDSIFFIPVSSDLCRYDEHLYYLESKENAAAEVFFEEFCRTFCHD